MFVNAVSSENLIVTVEPPAQSAIKKKAIIVIKARPETKDVGFPTGIANEVVFMELNRPVLENLYQTCQVSNSTIPVRATLPTWE